MKEKLQGSVTGAKAFASDVMAEIKKATWPSRRELLESTVVVIVSLVILSVFVGVSDRVLAAILEVLIPAR